MDALLKTIDTTPIIDNHAHNLLQPEHVNTHSLLSLTSEAHGSALPAATSTLAHLRAVKQLSQTLDCAPEWPAVLAALEEKRKLPEDAWSKQCFQGIETVLVDDGLDSSTIYPWAWHSRLTRSRCFRIVRIEKVAEELLESILLKRRQKGDSLAALHSDAIPLFHEWTKAFSTAMRAAIADPDVVAFKSVICYRTGLDIPALEEVCEDSQAVVQAMQRVLTEGEFTRLEDDDLSPYFVHISAALISSAAHKGKVKPLQFHTGLGDNDITLSKSSPALLQSFIEGYEKLPIVLLHASYPFTKEAGYLAAVFENVYLDIGEVFPMISQEGQENVIRESLELCPSEKLMWSTDGHWYPETYLLAILQIREGLKEVLQNTVRKGALTIPQAINVVEDVLFNTSNRLYNLGLDLKPLKSIQTPAPTNAVQKITNLNLFQDFLAQNPSVKYLRLQWLDYTSTLRLRLLSIKQAISLFSAQKCPSITKANFGLLQIDHMAEGFGPTGEYDLIPILSSIKLGQRVGYATLQCEFREKDGRDVGMCPRTALRKVVEKAAANDINFLLGFEVEIVFIPYQVVDGKYVYDNPPLARGHAWSTANSMRDPTRMTALEEILSALEAANIELLMLHPESASGQYEFVLGALPPLEAVDSLIAAREIIQAVGEKFSFRATLVPKPLPMACGTGAHVHMSLTPESAYPSFYAGILKHLRAIAAFTLSGAASYERMQDSVWSGGRWVSWGTQNREVPLRKIEGSHWEMKCLDGLANPYFAIAAVLAAGTQGVLDGEELKIKDCDSDPALLGVDGRANLGIKESLPKSIEEALGSLEDDTELAEVVGKELVKAYLAVKTAEAKMLEGMETEEKRIFFVERY